MYSGYLISSLERLFSDIESPGFWDDKNDKIIESLYHDEFWNWKFIPGNNNRYPLFCMGMLLLSREIYGLETLLYDEKIKRFLLKIKSCEETYSSSELTYGALLSLILGEKIYNLKLVTQKTKDLFNESILRLNKSTDNQDYILLIAAYYYHRLYPSDDLVISILKIQKRLLDSLNQKCYFETGDIRASYHQRIMYTLWGLIFTSPFGNSTKVKVFSKRIMSYFYNHRRLKDNAFIWHHPFYLVKYFGIKIPVYNKNPSTFLFECHQTFYVNAINFYQYIYQDKGAFIKEKQQAMDWLFGKNRRATNLVELTGLSLPCRIMTTDGRYFVEGENYKGSYEIGSYILALSSF